MALSSLHHFHLRVHHLAGSFSHHHLEEASAYGALLIIFNKMKKFNESIEQRLTARHKKCFQFCGNVEGKDILDIGSSFGWFEKMALQSRCLSVVGLEPRKEDFHLAQKEVPLARFEVGSALAIPFPDETFDMVVMFDVIEHIPKNTEPQAICEIKRVLRPDGRLILSTPFRYWLANLMDPAWYFGHRHYAADVLIQMMEKENLTVEKVEKRGRIFELISADLMYFFKWVFGSEIPFKDWFEKKRVSEYLTDDEGFETLYVRAVK